MKHTYMYMYKLYNSRLWWLSSDHSYWCSCICIAVVRAVISGIYWVSYTWHCIAARWYARYAYTCTHACPCTCTCWRMYQFLGHAHKRSLLFIPLGPYFVALPSNQVTWSVPLNLDWIIHEPSWITVASQLAMGWVKSSGVACIPKILIRKSYGGLEWWWCFMWVHCLRYSCYSCCEYLISLESFVHTCTFCSCILEPGFGIFVHCFSHDTHSGSPNSSATFLILFTSV